MTDRLCTCGVPVITHTPAICLDMLVTETMFGQVHQGSNTTPGYGGRWHWPIPVSSDLNAAWYVVNWLRAQPWYRGISLSDAPTQGGGWTCEIMGKYDGATGRLAIVYVAETLPLAIVRAALMAKANLAKGNDE